MDDSSQPARRPRPDTVLVLFIIYCIGALVFYGLFVRQLGLSAKGIDKSATNLEIWGAILGLTVRSVGMVRLFLMKADSWLWLVVALVIQLPITILGILNHRVIGSDVTAPVLASAVQYLIATGIIVYAFRLFNDPVKK
jgi:hypothetical protein